MAAIGTICPDRIGLIVNIQYLWQSLRVVNGCIRYLVATDETELDVYVDVMFVSEVTLPILLGATRLGVLL